jgi:hypothetical protein
MSARPDGLKTLGVERRERERCDLNFLFDIAMDI